MYKTFNEIFESIKYKKTNLETIDSEF